MASINVSKTVTGSGETLTSQVQRSPDNVSDYGPITLPVGKTGTLSTRTDANTGELTLTGGHGIVTGQIIDLYWPGGRRYNVVVGTVSTNVVPIDLGSGNDLPLAAAAIVATPQVQINTAIDGDNLSVLAIKAGYVSLASTAVGHISFFDAADDEIAAVDLDANSVQIHDIEGGDANAFVGDPITYCLASNGSSTEVATLYVKVGQDSTP